MARHYLVGGVRFHRRGLVKLTAAQRTNLAEMGRAVLRYAVIWPLPDSVPDPARPVI
jgi:hypothetical protein